MKRLFYSFLGLGAAAVIVFVLAFSISDTMRIVRGTPNGDLNAGNFYDTPVTHRGERMMVQPKDILSTGRAQVDVPPIMQPNFVSVDEALEQDFLHTSLFGLQLFDGEKYRFYPIEILAWHELVFDTIGDISIAIVYAPLADAFFAFETENLDLAYSGFVFNNTSLLIDRKTDTLYSPLLGKGVYGEDTGRALTAYPSSVIQWDIFAQSHPDGLVLSSETGFEFPYSVSPYGGYLTSKALIFPNAHKSNGARFAKDSLFGVRHEGGAKAFDFVSVVQESDGVKNDAFGGRAFVVWVDKFGALHVNERGDERFVKAETDAIIDEDGRRWTFDPLAQTLSHGEDVRAYIPYVRLFWFVWASTFQESEIYGVVRKQGLIDGPFTSQESTDEESVRIEVDENALESLGNEIELEVTSVESE